MSRSKQCPECEDGVIRCHTTRVNRERGTRTRYYRCNCCGYVPSKQVLSLDVAPISRGMEQAWSQRKANGDLRCPTSS